MEYHATVMGDEGEREREHEHERERERENGPNIQTSTSSSSAATNTNTTTATRPYDAARSPSQSAYNPTPFSPSRPQFSSPYAPAPAAVAAATTAPPPAAPAAIPAPSRNYYDPTKPDVPAGDRRPSWHEAQTPQVRKNKQFIYAFTGLQSMMMKIIRLAG